MRVTKTETAFPKKIFINVALALLYFGAARLGLSLALIKQVTPVWPPSGIALAGLLIYGYGVSPGIFIGAFAANAMADESIPLAATIAIGNMLEGILGAVLLNYFKFEIQMERRRDVVCMLIFAALVSTLAAALLGAANLCAGHIVPWNDFAQTWRTWWLGDALGDLVVAPLLLTIFTRTASNRGSWGLGQACLFAALIAVCYGVFAAKLLEPNSFFRLAYVVFPFAICSAIYFSQLEAALAVFVISGFAIWGTVHQPGTRTSTMVEQELISLQLFMAVVATTTLLLGALTGERRRTEALLRESEAMKSNILASALDPIISIDGSGKIFDFNPAAEEIFALNKKEVLGKTLAQVFKRSESGSFCIADLGTTPQVGRLGERRVTRPNGTEWYADLIVTKAGSDSYTIFLHDINDRKTAELKERAYQDRLRALVSTNMDAEEQRRRRFANSVQEEIGNGIEFVRDKLQIVSEQFKNPDVANSASVVQQLALDARAVAEEISPPILYDGGLEAALQWLIETVQKSSGLPCAFENDGKPKPMKDEVRGAIFSAVRELLANSVRHSKAKFVHVSIRRENDNSVIKVMDNGVGFAPPKSKKGEDWKGGGLFCISERLNHLGGSMTIDSAAGIGCTVTLTVPCQTQAGLGQTSNF